MMQRDIIVEPGGVDGKKQTRDWKQRMRQPEFLIFLALNIILVPVSIYQTYKGYADTMPGEVVVPLAIALATGLMLLGLNFVIEQRRREGKKHLHLILLYLIPLAFSFLGNFHAFYAQATRDALIRDDIERMYTVFMKTTTPPAHIADPLATTNPSDSCGVQNLYAGAIEDLNNAFNEVEKTFKGGIPDELGYKRWGTSTTEQWHLYYDLAKQLGCAGTMKRDYSKANKNAHLRPTSMDMFDRLVRPKHKQVLDCVDKKAMSPVKDLLNEIAAKRAEVDTMKSQLDDKPSLGLTDMKRWNALVVPSNNQLGNAIKSKADCHEFELLENSDKQLADFPSSFKSAYIDWDRPVNTWLYTFIALLIDLAALFYVLAVIAPNRRKRRWKPQGGIQSI